MSDDGTLETGLHNLVVVAGMSRAGTTFLYHNLQKHPEVFLPTRKEACFFAHNFDKGYGWFESFYRSQPDGTVPFDICGHYFTNEEALDRIMEFTRRQRVILAVRDPVDWAFSLYEHYSRIYDTPPLQDFFAGTPIAREGREIAFNLGPGSIRRRLETFQEKLGPDLLLYDFDEFGRNPLAVLKAIESFAGLSDWFAPGLFDNARINARNARRIGVLDKVLRLPGAPTLISRVMPQRVLRRIRSWVDLASARRVNSSSQTVASSEHDPGDRQFVERLFEEDRAFVRELFADEPIRQG